MTGQDIVLVLGAYSALVLAAFGMLIKFVLDTRKQATETNTAVNNRPKHEPTLRDLVEGIDGDMRELRHEQNSRHRENTDNMRTMSGRISRLELDLKAHMKDTDDDRIKTDDDRAKRDER